MLKHLFSEASVSVAIHSTAFSARRLAIEHVICVSYFYKLSSCEVVQKPQRVLSFFDWKN
jgi:hypothetical protein